MNKKILLLGSDGYIGARLMEYLHYDVTSVDLGWFGKIYSDTLNVDYRYLEKEFIAKFTDIILLAAHSSVSMCTDNLPSSVKNNVVNFMDLLEKINSDQRLIYTSTAAIYEPNLGAPNDENYAISYPRNPYDYTKITREQIASIYQKNTIGLRLGSVNGFSKNMRQANLINSLTATHIRGEDLVISNGDKMRALVGINDVCRSIQTILESEGVINNFYNIVSVNDTIGNFGNEVQKLSGAGLINNDSFKTDFSFNCSSELFESDYNFKFEDTTESIFTELMENQDSIITNYKREPVFYV